MITNAPADVRETELARHLLGPGGGPRHVVQWYRDETELAAALGPFIASGLTAGETVMVVHAAGRGPLIEALLAAHGIDRAAVLASGQLVLRSAEASLGVFMDGDTPDPERFRAWTEGALGDRRSGPLRVFGEMVDVLWRAGNPRGAIQLEALWNVLGEALPLVLMCAYQQGEASDEARREVDCAHSHVVTARARGEAVEHAQVMADELSRRHGLEEALRVARERESRTELALENKLRELDGLAYMASHDLAAPLRAISNLAQWVVDDLGDAMTAESRRLMQLLQSRVARMENLIEGLLAYTRAGRTTPPLERVDVAALLAEVIAGLGPPPAATITLAGDLPTLETERVMLRDVLHHLIGNAIKHADRADVRIHVTAGSLENLWHFSVSDDGPGIHPTFHERIFKPLTTLQSRDTRESTGIGLAIVDKLVRMRGGRVWVESAVGQGATFHFTWPAAPWARAPRGAADGPTGVRVTPVSA